jgi:hypothetical protein
MKSVIDKAWEINLTKNEGSQWSSKEEIIKRRCPSDFQCINLRNPSYCNELYNSENCNKCWNREIEKSNTKEKVQVTNNLTFEDLKESPIKGIELDPVSEEYLIDAIRDDEQIIYMDNSSKLTYENLPIIIKYLQDVYEYGTELKKSINYVDFKTAKEYMEKGNSAQIRDRICDKYCEFSLYEINSNKWLLL